MRNMVWALAVGLSRASKPGERRRRVLFGLTGGWSAQTIADELFDSLTTVRSPLRSTRRKLNARSQLAAEAIANGLSFEVPQRTDQLVAASLT